MENLNYCQHRGEGPSNIFSPRRDEVPQPLISDELIGPGCPSLTLALAVPAAGWEVWGRGKPDTLPFSARTRLN